jgi:hypothetical protein
MPLDIANGFYESFSPQLTDLVCRNLRPVVVEAPAYSQTALRSTDGIDSFIDSTHKIARGSVEVLGVPYFVQGNQLFSVAESGTRTDLGTISGTGRVSIAASQTIIWIVVPGGDAYTYTIATSTLAANADTLGGNGPANSVAFKDSFFLFTNDTIIFNSNLDGITFSPLDFGTAEYDRDTITTGFTSNGQYYVAGTRSIQVFRTVGGAGFPFAPVPNATLERGIASRFGFVKADNTFFFMGGGDNQEVAIWRYEGSQATKVSSPALDHFMQGLGNTEIEGVFAWSYQTDGEEYVGFTFANKTYVYQVEASKRQGRNIWHERESSGTRWRVNTIVKAHNRLYVGDERTDKIGIINSKTFTEYGDTVKRIFTTQPFNFDGAPAFVGSYEMAMAVGVGNASTTDPVVTHRYSTNGITFLPASFTRKMGKQGEFGHRVVWRRMGNIEQQRVLEFSTNEPCETTFFRLEAEIEGGG